MISRGTLSNHIHNNDVNRTRNARLPPRINPAEPSPPEAMRSASGRCGRLPPSQRSPRVGHTVGHTRASTRTLLQHDPAHARTPRHAAHAPHSLANRPILLVPADLTKRSVMLAVRNAVSTPQASPLRWKSAGSPLCYKAPKPPQCCCSTRTLGSPLLTPTAVSQQQDTASSLDCGRQRSN